MASIDFALLLEEAVIAARLPAEVPARLPAEDLPAAEPPLLDEAIGESGRDTLEEAEVGLRIILGLPFSASRGTESTAPQVEQRQIPPANPASTSSELEQLGQTRLSTGHNLFRNRTNQKVDVSKNGFYLIAEAQRNVYLPFISARVEWIFVINNTMFEAGVWLSGR